MSLDRDAARALFDQAPAPAVTASGSTPFASVSPFGEPDEDLIARVEGRTHRRTGLDWRLIAPVGVAAARPARAPPPARRAPPPRTMAAAPSVSEASADVSTREPYVPPPSLGAPVTVTPAPAPVAPPPVVEPTPEPTTPPQ